MSLRTERPEADRNMLAPAPAGPQKRLCHQLERQYLSYRKAHGRLQAILEHYDFAGKRVLDLGCHRGYFAFGLASRAAQVTGIDGDADVIAHNTATARQHGIHNLKFEQAFITPEFIARLPRYDVVLFLSVLHHIITDSRVYSWYQGKTGLEVGREILRQISTRTDAIFFEIGLSSEAHDWAPRMPDMGAAPERWVVENLLLPAGFRDVQVIPPPEFGGLLGGVNRFLHSHFHRTMATSMSFPIRIARRLTSFDTRDRRPLFFARGAAPGSQAAAS